MTEIDLNAEALNMIPLFTGYVGAAVFYRHFDQSPLFNLTGFEFAPPDSFIVRFACGLALRVRVEAVEE